MVATAAWCSRWLTQTSYDLALNLGLCGSFDSAFAPGSVVHVAADRLAELGAEDEEGFLTIHELGLLDSDEFPFRDGLLVNTHPPANSALRSLPTATAITVNTVHGRRESIAAVAERFTPQIESMEGAAFMYACLIQAVPFAQVRAVSNIVEPRNRAAWKVTEAVEALCATAYRILDEA
jgi:futalosine hydrolase